MANRPKRVQSFSYQGLQRYFVTTCTSNRVPHFADEEHASALSMQISPIFATWSFEVIAYCVMPDHVHVLLEGISEDADFRNAVRVWKLQTGYAWRMKYRTALWQIGYWERVLRENDDARGVVRYLLENPVRAGLVRRFDDYKWSGSARFTLAELATDASTWNLPWKRR